ncbi:MAG: hypothetical protein AB1546_15510, partial [bacterium]
MRHFYCCLIIFLLAVVASCEEKINTLTLTPEKMEDKVAMADVVIIGTVIRVQPADEEKGAMVRSMIKRFIAEVEVKEIIKGVVPTRTVKVEFEKSANRESPERVSLSA